MLAGPSPACSRSTWPPCGGRGHQRRAVEGARSLAKVTFPRRGPPGDYRFDIGTAGATSLVLQTIFLPLGLDLRGLRNLEVSSEVTLIGGTHVPWSPASTTLTCNGCPICGAWDWTPSWKCLGGVYPQGNGQVHARIEPVRD